ncbi:MAG: hypothetical protein HUJ31_04540 [Pseudomonadales bacterium]|nr:hypothetical protein [Pseudomonadales bacterium]
MRSVKGSVVIASILLVQACSEGGIGGTGTITDPSTGVTLVDVSGQANKGPFSEGAEVHARTRAGDAMGNSATNGHLGEFTVRMEEGVAGRIDITGRFFSENRGVMSDDGITLSAMAMGDPEWRANVNVGTHLVHQRIVELMDSGLSFEEAVSSAHEEMIEAMSEVIPAPANPVRFNELVVINAAQAENNPEGNAWLLTCTSLLERVAISRSEANGTTMEAELQALLDEMSAAFADDGTLPAGLMSELMAARSEVNPDAVHQHLFGLDDDLRDDVLMGHFGMSRMEASSMECSITGSEIECMSGGGMGGGMYRMELEGMVANMNRFMDTDGDGIVNHDDDDDDGDGIPDVDDDTPYGHDEMMGGGSQ